MTFSSVQFSRSVMSDSLRPHELQHARPPCPSPTPGVYSRFLRKPRNICLILPSLLSYHWLRTTRFWSIKGRQHCSKCFIYILALLILTIVLWGRYSHLPCGSEDKESAYNAGDLGLIPISGRPPGEGNCTPLQYSCLENPMDRGAWWLQTMGSQRAGHDWATNIFFLSYTTYQWKSGIWFRKFVPIFLLTTLASTKKTEVSYSVLKTVSSSPIEKDK